MNGEGRHRRSRWRVRSRAACGRRGRQRDPACGCRARRRNGANVDVEAFGARIWVSATRRISPCPGRKTRIDPLSLAARSSGDAHDLVLDSRPWVRPTVSCHDREGAALALNRRRITLRGGADACRAHQRRRRGREVSEILTQTPAARRGQGEAKIGVERAFVELFIEQNRRHAVRGEGSSRVMRANTPSVTTSMQVRSKRGWSALQRGGRSLRRRLLTKVAAMQAAAARAAERRGSSEDEALALHPGQLAEEGASGALMIVLPAPGGAASTAAQMLGERRAKPRRARRRWEEERRGTSIARPR